MKQLFPIEPIFGDSEIDFDDELDDDQYPLDTKEALEAGVLLDDPERLDPEAT
jgi:hypothetical protein